jgi:cob(I)alamin adenosyltransferase
LREDEVKMKKARILLFTGDGKGKTTASLGMALRAVGHGMKVLMIQFIKANQETGEYLAARTLPGLEIIPSGRSFLPPEGAPGLEEHRKAAREGLEGAARALARGECDLLILDEVCLAVAKNLLSESEVLALLGSAREDSIIVMTGRSATPGLLGAADTVTEMGCVKHGYVMGMSAQKGVEY